MEKYEKVLVGKTSINVSGIDIDVDIVRNESGNLEVQGYMEYFPNGTCIEGRNDEIEFYGFELGKKTLNNGGIIDTIDVDPDVVIDEIRERVKRDKIKTETLKKINDLRIEIDGLRKSLRDLDKKPLEVGSDIFHGDHGYNKIIDIIDAEVFLENSWTISNSHEERTIKSFAKDSYIAKTLVVI